MNKILLELQGDEIVYLGLEDAHEYYNQKVSLQDMGRLINALFSIVNTSLELHVEHKYLKPKVAKCTL